MHSLKGNQARQKGVSMRGIHGDNKTEASAEVMLDSGALKNYGRHRKPRLRGSRDLERGAFLPFVTPIRTSLWLAVGVVRSLPTTSFCHQPRKQSTHDIPMNKSMS